LASHPGIVAQMLAVSGAEPGGRVLEIGTGTGRKIVGKAWFMWLRDQRVPRVSVGRFVRDNQHADTSMTEVHPYEVARDYDT
jgi:hypothetical protein